MPALVDAPARLKRLLVVAIALGASHCTAPTPTTPTTPTAPTATTSAAAADAGAAISHAESVTAAQPPTPAPASEEQQVFHDFPATDAPLEQIKLRATHLGRNRTADIEMPSGQMLTLKVGSLIGNRLGQVTAIKDGVVLVTEEPRDARGKRIPTKAELRVPPK